MKETQKGGWVHYEDYAQIKAEVERHIKARHNDDMAMSEKEDPFLIPRHLVVWWMDECKKAQAEVEKLHARWLQMLDENKDLRQTNGQYHQVLSANRNLETENARLKAESNALDTEVKAMWKENRELRDRIDLLTPPLWLRVLAWLVSFVGAFWLAQILFNWMHR
jgi:hypothetical protein